jgi:hypothetical protein
MCPPEKHRGRTAATPAGRVKAWRGAGAWVAAGGAPAQLGGAGGHATKATPPGRAARRGRQARRLPRNRRAGRRSGRRHGHALAVDPRRKARRPAGGAAERRRRRSRRGDGVGAVVVRCRALSVTSWDVPGGVILQSSEFENGRPCTGAGTATGRGWAARPGAGMACATGRQRFESWHALCPKGRPCHTSRPRLRGC